MEPADVHRYVWTYNRQHFRSLRALINWLCVCLVENCACTNLQPSGACRFQRVFWSRIRCPPILLRSIRLEKVPVQFRSWM